MEMSRQLRSSTALSPGKEPRCPETLKLDRHLPRHELYREVTNLFPLLGIEPRFSSRPSHKLVYIVTEPGSWVCSSQSVYELLVELRYVHFSES
jgi:hypothetical protein